MSDSAIQAARKMLERQLEELGSLYNAGVRSPVFREWRQGTLTCIQRIWPAEPAKSERFRRIPFSAPMGRPAEREVREYFERGCGEAAGLLKELIQEIATVGLGAGAGPSAAMAPPTMGSDDEAFPTVELPGPSAAQAPPKPRLKDLLGFTDLGLVADAPVASPPPPHGPAPAQPVAGPAPLPHAPAPAQPVAGPASLPHAPAPAQPLAGPAPMSGIVSNTPPGPGLTWATDSTPANAEPQAPMAASASPHGPPGPPREGTFKPAEIESHGFFAPPAPSAPAPAPAPASTPQAAPQPRLVVTGSQPAPHPATPAPPSGVPDLTANDPLAAAARAVEEAARGADPAELERIAEELLRASASLSAVPRRTGQDRRANPRELQSGVAMAIAALGLEVEALGVPDGHRARTRAMLLDLSRRLDAPNLPWETLREAIGFVMEYPALGRRVIPLLLPFLDRAA